MLVQMQSSILVMHAWVECVDCPYIMYFHISSSIQIAFDRRSTAILRIWTKNCSSFIQLVLCIVWVRWFENITHKIPHKNNSYNHWTLFTDDIKTALSSFTNVTYAQLALDEKPDYLCWKLPKNNLCETSCIWIGDDNQSLFNLSLTVNGNELLIILFAFFSVSFDGNNLTMHFKFF